LKSGFALEKASACEKYVDESFGHRYRRVGYDRADEMEAT
jgi:hypothetical protein